MALPPLYDTWLSELLGGPLPDEPGATCDDCAMVPRADAALDEGAVAFVADVKCCTYLPSLPNFLAGRILSDEDPAGAPGRSSLRARLASGVAVTPLGVGQTPEFRALYRAEGAELFGRSEALRCPHLVDGRCTIWQHRNGTCATWFCKHERGAVGLRFWRSGVLPLLKTAERSLALWCLVELGLDAATLGRLLPPGSDGDLLADVPRGPADWGPEQWGEYVGREEELFVRAGALVAQLGWKEVLAIGGADLQARAVVARDGHARLRSSALPASFVAGPHQVSPRASDGSHGVRSYSPHDRLRLPDAVVAALERFDGRPRAEVERSLTDEERALFDDQLLLRLVDFEVLIPPWRLTLRR